MDGVKWLRARHPWWLPPRQLRQACVTKRRNARSFSVSDFLQACGWTYYPHYLLMRTTNARNSPNAKVYEASLLNRLGRRKMYPHGYIGRCVLSLLSPLEDYQLQCDRICNTCLILESTFQLWHSWRWCRVDSPHPPCWMVVRCPYPHFRLTWGLRQERLMSQIWRLPPQFTSRKIESKFHCSRQYSQLDQVEARDGVDPQRARFGKLYSVQSKRLFHLAPNQPDIYTQCGKPHDQCPWGSSQYGGLGPGASVYLERFQCGKATYAPGDMCWQHPFHQASSIMQLRKTTRRLKM